MNQLPATSTPAKTEKIGHGNLPIITTPWWVSVIRGFQFFFSIVILALAGYIIHYVYMDELGLALTMSLFTWVIVVYVVVSEKISSLHGFYNVFAVLGLDAFSIILWLSSMGAAAARRATFTVSVNASCTSDGSAVNSGKCVIYKRAIVMSQTTLSMLSGIAGLSALNWLLFIATFAYTLMAYLKHRKANAPAAATVASQGEIQMETKQPFLAQSQQFAPQSQPYNSQTQQYPPQTQQYAPQTQQAPPQQPYSPHQNYQESPVHHSQIYQGPPPGQQAYEAPANQVIPPGQRMYEAPANQATPPGQQTYEAPTNQAPAHGQQAYEAPAYHEYQQQHQQPYIPAQTPVSQVSQVSPTNSPAPQGQMYPYPPQH